MKSLFYCILLIIAFLSCSKKELCPPDQILGSLSLSDNSRDFLPYNGIHFLEFVDSAALDTAILFSQYSLIHDSSRTVIENICMEDIERTDKYYNAEHKTIDFYDIDTSRKFRIIGNLSVNEDHLSKFSTLENPVLYDELKLTVHRSNPSQSGAVATIEFVTNDRGNKDRMSDSLLSKIKRYPFKSLVLINDITYNDVYEYYHNDSLYFYFKPLKGVVAFRDLNNKWWHLRRAY